MKLVQQPLYSTQKKLIPPWSTQEELRQGMFVNVEAKLNVHHFGVFDRPSSIRSQCLFLTSRLTRLHRFTLQTCEIVATRVRVLAKSPAPYEHITSNTTPSTQISSQASSQTIESGGLFDELDNTVGGANDQDSDAEVHATLKGSGKRPFLK